MLRAGDGQIRTFGPLFLAEARLLGWARLSGDSAPSLGLMTSRFSKDKVPTLDLRNLPEMGARQDKVGKAHRMVSNP